jgi:small subunit ribosomal protein S9
MIETEEPREDDVEPTSAPDEPPAESPEETPDVTESQAEPTPDQAEGEDPDAAQEGPAAEAAEQPEEQPERPRPQKKTKDEKAAEPEVIPGAHLEPDLVLDQPAETEADEYAQYADADLDSEPAEAEAAPEAEPAPAARTPLELAADARYQATGKRKTAVARVILKPGSGAYTINGRTLEEYFPRPRLQRQARGPLETTGNDSRMDVVARIHGSGVAAQAGALRHGIARALVEAEPTLRVELKRRGFLTRDPREKERRKAGLKKARKRPQFSKR